MEDEITARELREAAGDLGVSLDAGECAAFVSLSRVMMGAISTDAQAPATTETVPSRAPTENDDPCNAVVRWCEVARQDTTGALAGLRVAVKESLGIAGLPMTCGSSALRDFVPVDDCVAVHRLCEAGARIVAQTNMDDLAFSGAGDSSWYGPVRNPHDADRTAGGSSGGSAAVLHYRCVDGALGTDQAGSSRIPASWCGVHGLKPTHGLVPYTGAAGLDPTVDHIGPMARHVATLARLLEAVAGSDGADHRQPADLSTADYSTAAHAGLDLRGVRLGVLRSAVDARAGVEEAVADAVLGVVDRIGELGAEITEVDVAGHASAGALSFPVCLEGMVTAYNRSYGHRAAYWPELSRAFGAGLGDGGAELSPPAKASLLFGQHLRRRYFGSAYGRAQNLRRQLTAEYDAALAEVDFLVLPTTPCLPYPVVTDGPVEQVVRGWTVLTNTVPMNLTGHPAISVPLAEHDGLPVGVQFVAPHWTEERLLALTASCTAQLGTAPVVSGRSESA